MKQEFQTYLSKIGITDSYLERADYVFEFFSNILKEDIINIFVSDYYSEDNQRNYESLWLFTKTKMCEAKQFLLKDDYDMAPYSNAIFYLQLEKTEYDFKKASNKSRLSVTLELVSKITCIFKASATNCDYLKKIYLEILIPNFKQNIA